MDLIAYWGASPPPHLLLAAYMGIGPKPKPKMLDECTDAEMEEFLGMVNGG